jgi:histidinol-phosphatase (PHP family)
MAWVNFHSHTSYCDGISQPEGYIIQAIEAGMFAYGFSGHAPMPFDTRWAIKQEQLPLYIAEIQRLKDVYKQQIEIYCALEVDYIPGVTGTHLFTNFPLDYIIGAIHFVGYFPNGKPFTVAGKALDFDKGLKEIYGNDIKRLVKAYFALNCELIQKDTPHILAHADLIKNGFLDNGIQYEKWYQHALFEMIDLAAQKDVIIEINTRGLYKQRTTELYPSEQALRYMKQKGVRMMLSADTHLLTELTSGFEYAVGVLHNNGINELTVFRKGQFVEVSFSSAGFDY